MSGSPDAGQPRGGLADKEWINVQKKTFTNWVNDKLKATDIQLEDIQLDLKDGVALITLLQILAPGKKMPGRFKPKPRMEVHKRENIEIAFRFMQDVEKIPMVNIGANDIYQTNLKLILGLIWALILRYQIAGGSTETKASKEAKKKRKTAKKLLVNWVTSAVPRGNVTNFTTSWNDGLALSALVDYCKPGLIPDHASLDPSNGLENIKNAMDIAEKELGVPQVMHPEDMAVEKPDELSVMTYVSGFCRQDAPGRNSLLDWINKKIPNQPVSNLSSDWSDGRALAALTDAVSGGQFPESEQMEADDSFKNCEEAMEGAHSLLGIEKTVPPEEFAEADLDELTRMSYLAQFQHATPPSLPSLASTMKAVGHGVTGDSAEKETSFLVRGPRIPKWAKVEVTVKGPSQEELPLRTQAPSGKAVSFHYTPPTAGAYVVDIKLNGECIPNSPTRVNHTPPTNVQGCLASGDGLAKACVGDTSTFSVNCEKGGPGELRVDVEGPNGNVGTDIEETVPLNYDVNFTPLESGPHEVSITWADKHIPNSPFECVVTDPKRCTVSGRGLTRASVNDPQTFNVKAEKAGPGVLTVEVQGPSGSVPVQTKETGNGLFNCTYIPKDKGPHVIDIKWSEAPIVGSPFKVNVTAPADASKCTVSDLPEGRLRANKTYSFNVNTSEAGSGDLTASAHGPSVPENCTVSEDQTVYTVNFIPAEVGEIKVDVSYGDSSIPDSPFEFMVNDPSKVKVNRTAIESGTYQLKQPCDFRVSAQYAGEGELTASFKGPSGEDSIEVKGQSDKSYLLHICPEEGGPHAIGIKFDGDNIPGVPIRIFVEATSLVDNVIVSQPTPSKIGSFLVDHPYAYRVNASGAGSGDLTATGVGARTGSKPQIDISDLKNGQYSVTVNADLPDEYIIDIMWSEEAIPGSPFNILVEDKPRPEKVVTVGPHFEIGSPDPVTLDVNTENAGAGKLTATVYGNEVGSVSTEITEEEPKRYKVSFVPPKHDVFSISVLWSSENVTNSPFKINLIPPDASKCVVTGPEVPADPTEGVDLYVDATRAGNGSLAATSVGDVTGETDAVITETDPNKFTVSFLPALSDYYTLDVTWAGKPVPGSPFRVNSSAADAENVVICEPPTAMLEAGQAIGICFDTSKGGRGELTAIGKGNKAGEIPVSVRQRSVAKAKYDVRFTPPEPDVYVISVLWAGRNVKGSPFTINLMPVDVTQIRVIGPNMPVGINGPVEMMLQTSGAGKGKVTGTCAGRKAGNVPVAIKETSTDIYQLGFVPPEPDIYTLAVQYGGQSLSGSPFLVNTLPSNSKMVRVTEPDPIAVSESLHYKVDATDAGSGKLFTVCRGENYGQVQLDTIEESPALYDIAFTPHHSDLYLVTMEWEGEKVSGSPFKVDLRPPMADKVKVGELHVPPEAGTGEEVWVDIDCSDAGHGDIQAEARGELVGKLTVEADKLDRTKYRVKFPPVQADVYHFAVAYGEDQIPSSPFYINLVPPQPNLVRHVSTTKPEGSHGPVVLLFDTKNAGNGEMTADIAGDTCGVVPEKVEKTAPTQWTVTFIPKEQEMYNAAILWAKRPVKGSPFRIDARPTLHPQLVECGKPLYTDINQPATLAVDLRKAGPGVITGKCTNEQRKSVPVSVSKGDSPEHWIVSFVPETHSMYQLSVFFEDSEVAGSPFPVSLKLVDELADMNMMDDIVESIIIPEGLFSSAPNTSEERSDVKGSSDLTAYIGEPLNLEVDVEDESKRDAEMVAIGSGSRTGPVPVQVSKNADGTFNVHFDPTTPDRYTIDVKLDGEHVPNSPLIVNYLAPIDSAKCRIFGLQDIPPVPQVHKPIHFGVDAKGAGQAKLSVTSDGPSMEGHPSLLEVKESDKGEAGIYNITYAPTCMGQHRVHLLWGKDAIPGSPLTFEVGDVSKLQTFPFGKPVAIDFSVDRKSGDLEANAFHEDSRKKYKVKINKQSKGKFKLGFQPQEPGIYAVHVLMKKNEIPGSPYRIRVLPPPNPSGVVVEGLENGTVNQPLVFTVNAKQGGGGDLGVRVSGLKEINNSDLQVAQADEDGLYTVKYTPRDPGPHSFQVSWAGTPIPNSPFSVDVAEMKPEIRKGILANATNLVEVGQPADVRISNVGSNVKEDFFSTQCVGEKSGAANVSLEREEDGSYLVRFVPSVADDYALNVKLNKTNIEGSPFSIKAVDKGVLSPNFNHPPGLCHSDVKAAEIVNVIARADDIHSPSDVTVTAEGPYGSCPAAANTELDGAVGLSFVPPLSGDYLVHAKKSGSDIGGSPFKVRAYGKEPDPSKVGVIDEDMAIFDKVLPFGRAAKFRISTVDAGPGTLNITSRGPGKAEVKVFDNKDGTYTCEFTPSIAGKYHIDILWNDKHIKGSPYLLTFKSKKSRVITGLDLENENFRIDVPHRFKLHCDELGEGILQITCTPSSAALVRLTPIPGGNSYQCEIVPQEVGNHQVCVQYNGKHILGSPFNVQFELRGDASKCRMVESSIEHEQEDTDNVSFCISTEGAGRGKLTAHVENTESKKRIPVSILQTSNDRYNVEFNPADGEEYLLTVKYDEQHILGSPFKLVFGPPEVDASRCTAEGDGLVACIIDKWETFVVDTGEAGAGKLNIAIEGEGGITVEPKISALNETRLEVKYLAPRVGQYKIFVHWGDNQIPKSPFIVNCYAPSDPNLFQIENASEETFMGVPLIFTVKAGNSPGVGELTVVAQSAQNKNATGVVKQENQRTYSCSVDIPETGRYMMHVRWNGSHVQGSPFKVKVMSPPKPWKVKAYGPGLEDGVVGQEGNFTVETGEGGAGTLAVRVHGPKGAFKINMRRHPDNERSILVHYDPNHSGKYTIDITWSETHIPGSPFTVRVKEQNS